MRLFVVGGISTCKPRYLAGGSSRHYSRLKSLLQKKVAPNHRDSMPLSPVAGPPSPTTRQIRGGRDRSQALAVWASLLDRTSVSLTQVPPVPDATVKNSSSCIQSSNDTSGNRPL